MIFFNGHIRTMKTKEDHVEAMRVLNGKIVSVGSNDLIGAQRAVSEDLIDLKGRTVIPGINESHIHLLNFGYSFFKVDLEGLTSKEAIIQTAKAYIKEKAIKPGDWLLGRGWNEHLFETPVELTRHDLDKISTQHPISFTRIDEHSTVANSYAINLAKEKGVLKEIDGGSFDLEDSGEALGIFRENARYIIYDMIPVHSVSDVKKMILRAAEEALKNGVTSVQSDDFEALSDKDYRKVIQAYRELSAEGKLPIRVYEQCLLPSVEKLECFLKDGYVTGLGDDYFKIGPLKLLTDGTLGSRTAYLGSPYADDETTVGMPIFTKEELETIVLKAHSNNMQILTHAIGDGAMDMCLSSFEKAMDQYPARDPRFGVVHLQLTTEALLDRFKDLNVLAYAEPIALNADLHIVESRIGRERANHTYNYRTLIDKGVKFAMSSDCPVDSINPMKNFHCAVTRTDYTGYPSGGWLPDQKISIEEAVYAFTMGSAYCSYEEGVKGSLEVGKLADFIVLSEDIFSIPEEDIIDTKILMTYVDGICRYKNTQI